MNLQKLYDSFTSLVDSISVDEMREETERAILDSSDSYLLGDMNYFEDELELEEVTDAYSVRIDKTKFISERKDALFENTWNDFDAEEEGVAA